MNIRRTAVSLCLLASFGSAPLLANDVLPAPVLEVLKTATCGCCKKWVEHAKTAGLEVKARDVPYPDLNRHKSTLGIDPKHRSCHTATSPDGYVFEGHIPAKLIKQFLLAPPVGALGLTVPAMPVGSPGMEYQGRFMPYKVHVLYPGGRTEVYAEMNHYQEQF